MLFLLRGAVDDIVAFCQHLQQTPDLSRWILQVIVHRDRRLAARQAQTAEQCIVLAIVAQHIDAAHPGVTLCQRLDDLPAPVPAAIVDQNGFIFRTNTRKHLSELGNQLLNGLSAVIYWD